MPGKEEGAEDWHSDKFGKERRNLFAEVREHLILGGGGQNKRGRGPVSYSAEFSLDHRTPRSGISWRYWALCKKEKKGGMGENALSVECPKRQGPKGYNGFMKQTRAPKIEKGGVGKAKS